MRKLSENIDCYELDKILNHYNWDDGFELPRNVMNHPHCELATALKAFYLAEGEIYLTGSILESEYGREWIEFLQYLYDKIVTGCYQSRFVGFVVPLTKVQKYKLLKTSPDTPAVFLQDIAGSKTSERCEQCMVFGVSEPVVNCEKCNTKSLHIEMSGLTYALMCENCGYGAVTTCIRPCLTNDTTPKQEFSWYGECIFKV